MKLFGKKPVVETPIEKPKVVKAAQVTQIAHRELKVEFPGCDYSVRWSSEFWEHVHLSSNDFFQHAIVDLNDIPAVIEMLQQAYKLIKDPNAKDTDN